MHKYIYKVARNKQIGCMTTVQPKETDKQPERKTDRAKTRNMQKQKTTTNNKMKSKYGSLKEVNKCESRALIIAMPRRWRNCEMWTKNLRFTSPVTEKKSRWRKTKRKKTVHTYAHKSRVRTGNMSDKTFIDMRHGTIYKKIERKKKLNQRLPFVVLGCSSSSLFFDRLYVCQI